MTRSYINIKSKYQDRIPVIVEGIKIDKQKYLVPNDFTVSQFVYVIRRKLSLKPEQGLYCLIKYENCSVIPKHSDLLIMYEKNDYLHFYFCVENVFG